MDMFDIFRTGAMSLAKGQLAYLSIHEEYGIAKHDWDLLTQSDYWTTKDRHSISSILNQVINVSLTISSLPVGPLPVQYVAACIAVYVSDCNILNACHCAPATYDGVAASGLEGEPRVNKFDYRQLISLVVAYRSKEVKEPIRKVDSFIADQSVKAAMDIEQESQGIKE